MLNVRDLQRHLSTLLPDARSAGAESTLEIISQNNDAPRLVSATLLEDTVMSPHPVTGAATAEFRAFLDGTQRTRVATYSGNTPILLGNVAAAIRERRDRRMHTWERPIGESRVYVARDKISPSRWDALQGSNEIDVVDTTADAEEGAHPFALRDAVLNRVRAHRASVERRLAEEWCSRVNQPLFVDGGISGSTILATSGCAVGVIKSHRILWAEGAALEMVCSLRHRERSSVFSIAIQTRTRVASWYLRMRDPEGRDPMWGLVRVEVAYPSPKDEPRIGAHADEISRRILAEVSPLALPDARWDKMVYGIRDCEEYLRAVAQ